MSTRLLAASLRNLAMTIHIQEEALTQLEPGLQLSRISQLDTVDKLHAIYVYEPSPFPIRFLHEPSGIQNVYLGP